MKTLEADIVIVGSGIAGAISAYKLAQKGLSVLVLEAGPRIERKDVVKQFQDTHKLDFSSGFPNEDWAPRPDWGRADGDQYIDQSTNTDIMRMEYLRVVGGTTWHWSANSIRLLPSEFKMKTNYGVAVDWPFDYEELEPYYSEAEQEMGVAAKDGEDDGSPRSAPYPIPEIPMSYLERTIIKKLEEKSELRFLHRPMARNSVPYKDRIQCQGFGTCSPICPSGAQYSAMVHIELAEKLGVKILDNMLVDRVITNDNNDVTGVEGRHPKDGAFSAKGKIVILAANGIETPKIMLMSKTKDRPNGIANRSGQVGRNFMEHPGLYCRFLMPEPMYPGRGPESTAYTSTNRDGAFRKEHSSWTMAMYNRMHLHDIAHDLLEKGMVPPELDTVLKDRALRQVEIDVHLEQLPRQENGITLDWDDLDSSGQPRMKLDFKYTEYETKSFEKSRKEFDRIVNLLGGEIIDIQGPFAHHHLMGMTRMGNDPKTSVTDGDGRTHEHDNLFVVSSSLFPTGGTANPTLTIAALALRTAEKIAKQLGK